MKRISFLKSLLGIAVAPMVIAKAIEQCDVKPHGLRSKVNKVNIFKPLALEKTDLWNEEYGLKVAKDIEYEWYHQTELETKKKFNQRLLEHYGKMNINEMAKKIG